MKYIAGPEQENRKAACSRSEVRVTRQRFETLAELADDGLIILDSDDNIVFASKSGADLLGYTRDELCSLTLNDLFVQQTLSAFNAIRSQAAKNPGAPHNACIPILPAWKSDLEVELSVIVPQETNETFISLRDLSLSRIIEKQLLKSNQFLRSIIMNSMDGIIAGDVSGHILLFNQGAEKMLGWRESEAVGMMSISDFFDPGVSEEILGRLRVDDEKDGPRGTLNPIDIVMVSKNGDRIPVSLTLSSIFEWGGEIATVGVFTDLRERVAMEKVIKETRDYLNNVVENAFDMIITTDNDTKIVSFNRGGERILGYKARELIGRSAEILYPNPEERRSLIRKIEHFDGAISNYETRLKHKNGSLVDISLTISLLRDNIGKKIGTVGISQDITARKKAEAELKATKDYLNAIVENTPDIIITTDLTKGIVSFNKGAERILGYSREEVMGRHIEDLYVDPDERKALADYLTEDIDSINYETQLKSASGKVVDIDLTLSRLRDDFGRVLGTVGISKDITEKKRIEEELKKKQVELEDAQRQVLHAEKLASLGKLATSVAHEINNPLGGILMFCEMILEETDEDHPSRQDLLQIREQTMRCKDIVKGLLEFGRMTGVQFSFIDLNRTVEQGIALFANQVIFQNIRVDRELDEKLPQIMGDASQLNQVFTNLIINAVDAMDGDGVLTIGTGITSDGREAYIKFSDTGGGIDDDDMLHIFEPFFTTKTMGKGIGLGLSTCYGIIKKHKGRIEVVSEKNKGSTFSVYLPLDDVEHERQVESD